MIIGFVGGTKQRREQLGEKLADLYHLDMVADFEELKQSDQNDCVVLHVHQPGEARRLHDDRGARLVQLEMKQAPKVEASCKEFCSFSLNGDGELKKVYQKLEMTLMGCC